MRKRLACNQSNEFLEAWEDVLRVFPSNSMCERYNIKKLRKFKVPILRIQSVLPSKNSVRADYDYDLLLYINAPVILTSNISVTAGLTNGRVGKIIRPVFSPRSKFPVYIIVSFKDWDQETILGGVPIPLISQDFLDIDNSYKSKRFPLRQASALTIFK